MRKFLIGLLLALIPGTLLAQSSTVTGQVTDAGGQSWNNGTIVATFVPNVNFPFGPYTWTGGTFGNAQKTVSGTLTNTGSYSISIPSNTAITPGNTQWLITVYSATTPQFTSSQIITVTGSPTVNFTPATISTGAAVGVIVYSTTEISTAVIGNTVYVIGAGLQSCIAVTGNSCTTWSTASAVPTVTTNPATCTVGQTFFNTLTSQFLLCVATNVLSTAAGSPATTIDAKLYGVLSDTRVLTSTTVSWTGATSTATVTATSSVFLPTDCAVGGSGCTGTVSKIMFGTNACCGGVAGDTGGLVTLPQGTIATYVSGTQVTVSFSGTSTACNTSSCIFVWGHDDTAALASAYTALLALGKDCGTLLLPAQKMLIQSALFITAPTCTGVSSTIGNTVGASETIEGFGMDSTMLIPTPSFNFATCTGGLGTACFLGWQFAVVKDWIIWGAGNSLSGGNNVHDIVDLNTESYADKFGIVAWGGSDTSLQGFVPVASGARVVNSIFRGAGQQVCRIAAANTWFVNTVCTYGNLTGLVVPAGGTLYSQNGFYGITNGSTSSIQVTGNYYGWGDVLGGAGGSANTTLVQLGGASYLNGVNSTCSLATANAIATNGGNIYATNSTFGGGSCNSVNRIANTYFDQGGNTYLTAAVGIAPTCAMTTGGGTGPACALVAGSTNEKGTVRMTPGTTPAATGTTTITFAGTYSGASGAAPSCVFDPANTGTGTWNIAADTQLQSRSTTVPVFTWNNTLALTATSTYDVDYVCMTR